MLMDLVPVDTVASLVLAAAAAAAVEQGQGVKAQQGATAGKGCRIYHASTSSVHPLRLPEAVSYLGKFFKANPAAVRLPLTR